MTTTLERAFLAAALVAVLPLAAGAQDSAATGKAVEIRTAEPPPPEAIQAAVRAVEGKGEGPRRQFQVRVSVRRDAQGTLSTLDLRGDTLPADAIPAAIRQAAPAFATAAIAVRPSAGAMEPEVPELEAEARRQLEAAGGNGQVEVKETQDEGGTRREVRVVIRKEKAGAE